jgi:hypothetical protein
MCITVVMASLDLEFGFRDFASEPFPEFDHARKLDDLWFGIRGDVQFVPFRVLVRVIIPTNRPIIKRAGQVRLRRAVVELVRPHPDKYASRSVRMQNTRTTVPSGYFCPSLTPSRSSSVSEPILIYRLKTNATTILVSIPIAFITGGL